MPLKICSKEFFSNYIFHTQAKELPKKERNKALLSSLCFGIFTFGIFHAVCAIKYRNRKFSLTNDGRSSTTVNAVYKKQKGDKVWSFEELLNTNKLNKDEIYKFAVSFRAAPELKFQLMLKAARMNHPGACYEIGRAFQFGEKKHAQKNIQEALIWFKKGAQLKDPSSCQALMTMYLNGEGVAKDIVEAEKWGFECLKYAPQLKEKSSDVRFYDSEALREYFSKLKVAEKPILQPESNSKIADPIKKIILRQGNFEVTTDSDTLKEVAKNHFTSKVSNRDSILADIFHHFDNKDFQKDPRKYIDALINNHKSDPVKNQTLSFLCALIRDLDTNPHFPWHPTSNKLGNQF